MGGGVGGGTTPPPPPPPEGPGGNGTNGPPPEGGVGGGATGGMGPPPGKFRTPEGHYSNPMDNVHAATLRLENIEIPEGATGQETRRAIEMLKTAMTQQALYPAFQVQVGCTRPRSTLPRGVGMTSLTRPTLQAQGAVSRRGIGQTYQLPRELNW